MNKTDNNIIDYEVALNRIIDINNERKKDYSTNTQ